METRMTVAQELWELFDRVHSMMISLIEDELRMNGRQPKQRLEVLKVVNDLGPAAIPARVAERLVREPHTISALLDRMVDDGMIRKMKDMPARNQVRLELTDSGEAMLLRSWDLDVVEQVFGVGANIDQLEMFKGQLERISASATLEYRTSRRKV